MLTSVFDRLNLVNDCISTYRLASKNCQEGTRLKPGGKICEGKKLEVPFIHFPWPSTDKLRYHILKIRSSILPCRLTMNSRTPELGPVLQNSVSSTT